MADPNIDPNKLKILEAQNKLLQAQLKILQEGYDLSSSYYESLKEIFGIKTRITQVDKDNLDISKRIHETIRDQRLGLTDIDSLEKQILKNKDLIKKAALQELDLSKKLSDGDETRIKYAKNRLTSIGKISKELEIELSKSKEEREQNSGGIALLQKRLAIQEKGLKTATESMSKNAQTLLYLQLQVKVLEKINAEEEKRLAAEKETEKKLGAFAGILKGLQNIPILGQLVKFNEVLDAAKANVKTTGSGIQGLFAGLGNLSKQALSGLTNGANVMSFIISAMIKGFFSLDKAQTEFQNETGKTISHLDTINTSLISSSDYIKTASALSKEWGANADAIFSKETLQEAAELVNLMGLSNEEASKLASLAKMSNVELKQQDENIISQVDNFNKANKTAFDGRAIMRDIGKTSSAISVNLGGNAKKIAEANLEARKLGLSLSQIDQIAESLLNFESSISNELEAELLSGKSLNFEKARLFALNNDIEGLTKEIAQNEGITSGFINGNRLTQDAIAKSIGLQREDLAKMIINQKTTLGLTDEQVQKASGLSEKDFKRLSVQDSLNKSIEKMGEALAGPVELLAQMANHAWLMKTIFVAIGAIIAGRIVAGLAASVVSLYASVAAQKAYGRALNENLTKEVALDAAKVAGAEATTLGAATPFIIGGIAAVLAALAGAAMMVGDVHSPAKGKTIVSTKEGGLFKLSDNDDFMAAPGLSQRLSSKSSSTIVNDNSKMISTMEEHNKLLKEGNEISKATYKKMPQEFALHLETAKFGTAINTTSYKTK
jgi:hypothetical protein